MDYNTPYNYMGIILLFKFNIMSKKITPREVALKDIQKAIKEEGFFNKNYLRLEKKVKTLCQHKVDIITLSS